MALLNRKRKWLVTGVAIALIELPICWATQEQHGVPKEQHNGYSLLVKTSQEIISENRL
ncbi:MAG: hypothetical protein RMK89_13020 [Armatimonadota bacterium]|nr:hypothetical protein [Armatimonadota bacterium]MDW8144370.1 hypothetical protein [Armatimonadota bacterium]